MGLQWLEASVGACAHMVDGGGRRFDHQPSGKGQATERIRVHTQEDTNLAGEHAHTCTVTQSHTT